MIIQVKPRETATTVNRLRKIACELMSQRKYKRLWGDMESLVIISENWIDEDGVATALSEILDENGWVIRKK